MSPKHTKLNPNGRIPTIVDHENGDFVIWESDAILLYLVDKYDTEKRLTVTDEKERYSLIQWLFFQASGQGYVLFVFNKLADTCTDICRYVAHTSAKPYGFCATILSGSQAP